MAVTYKFQHTNGKNKYTFTVPLDTFVFNASIKIDTCENPNKIKCCIELEDQQYTKLIKPTIISFVYHREYCFSKYYVQNQLVTDQDYDFTQTCYYKVFVCGEETLQRVRIKSPYKTVNFYYLGGFYNHAPPAMTTDGDSGFKVDGFLNPDESIFDVLNTIYENVHFVNHSLDFFKIISDITDSLTDEGLIF